MTCDDENGPLKAVYKIQRPRWCSMYTGRKYTGRPNWWSELGHSDSLSIQNKLLPVRYSVREKDPEWYDPPVPDGESIAGAFGKDTKYNGNLAIKSDTPGNLFKFKEKLMKSSVQYKQIAEKYDISPEHPGIAVSPTLNTTNWTPLSHLGLGGIIPTQSWHQWGPRFFDKPMNEGCFEKGLALMKYTALINIFYTYAKFQSATDVKLNSLGFKELRITDLSRRFLVNYRVPGAVSFGYGVAICTSATIRNRDDIYNPLIASTFSGILISTLKDNIPLGVSVGLALMVLGSAWHYQRLTRYGLQGPSMNQKLADYWIGPLAYQMVDHSHVEKPKDVY